jgi:hypothetical protein
VTETVWSGHWLRPWPEDLLQLEGTDDEDVAGDDENPLAQPCVVVVGRLVRHTDELMEQCADPDHHRSVVRR